MPRPRILVVRLGAMGDVVHALPAVASLKSGFPGSHLTWVIDPKWRPLIAGNPDVDEVVEFSYRDPESFRRMWTALRTRPFDVVVDIQGLIKSALIARIPRSPLVVGFHPARARERIAAAFYTRRVRPRTVHVVDHYVELALAAGVREPVYRFALPAGRPEGQLPDRPFVLACPFAGWASKQWPIERYSELARKLAVQGMVLVVNGPESARAELDRITWAWAHTSGIEGLIYATRQAIAVVGVDSGPLHIASALGKPGVAIYGPTDPARNGPYRSAIQVVRLPGASTTYRRGSEIARSMRAIPPGLVFSELMAQLRSQKEQSAR
ncbi:MAG TPA: glycosyltransferase family 9 protein [Bryobacteraceae bacterium]|jgi:heptosyltransferase-1|nr:glycosyltransferase family 9 protein [Bryobacteraceae bacterium]